MRSSIDSYRDKLIITLKYLKKEKWDKLRGSIDNYRDKLIITLLYTTGMRVGEFTKLKVEDIDFQDQFIRIPAENTKTKTGRTIYVSGEVLIDVRAYLKLEKKILVEIPLGRIGQSEDIAEVIVFFASEQARWFTGQMLYVGGGHVMLS